MPGGVCTAWRRKGYIIDVYIRWLVGYQVDSPFYYFCQELGVLKTTVFEFYIEELDKINRIVIAQNILVAAAQVEVAVMFLAGILDRRDELKNDCNLPANYWMWRICHEHICSWRLAQEASFKESC